MKLRKVILVRPFIVLIIISIFSACNNLPSDSINTDQELKIYPDYSSIIIPPNIAPMNFRIENSADKFMIQISNSKGRAIRIKTRSSSVLIPIKKWKKLLDEDRGGQITIRVFTKNTGERWNEFVPVVNEIATEEISSYISYRKLPASYILWNEMGIYQRSVEDFSESPVMVNAVTEKNCMNCHSFNAGNPDQFLFHMRTKYGGTVLLNNDSLSFLDTNTDSSKGAGVYPSWHPDGKIVAFSVNQIRQKFHSKKENQIYVFDQYSDIVLYDLDKNTIIRPEELASENLENLPSWAVDGNSLYYISSGPYSDTLPYNTTTYDLMSISYDKSNRKFGAADMLIDADEFGKSVTFPRESPKGKLIAFIAIDYGYFSIFNPEADVYLFNKETSEITKPAINSEFTESYPSWSANGAWLMYISKRNDGVLSQVWFSYVDENGNAGKAFVLPQKNPVYYDEQTYNFNRPEFISGKVKLNPRKVLSKINKGNKKAVFDNENSVSAASGATAKTSPVKEEGEEYHQD